MALKKKKGPKKAQFKEVPADCTIDSKKQSPNEVNTSEPVVPNPPVQALEPPQSDSAQGTVTTSESTKRKSGGPRSVCAMYKVVKKKAHGKKYKIRYNDDGTPVGSTRTTLQSYIGMLARTTVPIDIPSWPNVDPELKGKLWDDVQVNFQV